MAFIEKTDPVVINIKLTSLGREQLAKGQLKFSTFAIGDSEIDYSFINENGFNPSNDIILRPVDNSPKQLSFIPASYTGTPYTTIVGTSATPTIIENLARPFGFFNIITSGTSVIFTDPNHVKQPDAMVKIDTVTGGTKLKLFKSSTYGSTVLEPAVGDYLLIRWTNPKGFSTTGFTVISTAPTPYLFYKIQAISGGSLGGDNLVIAVDRDLPDFGGQGSGINAGALIFYNQITVSGDPCFSTDFIAGSTFAFFENCQSPGLEYPFWNMSIVFTEEIAGVQTNNRKYGKFGTAGYNGFVSYIQNQAPFYKKLGIIHYTNPSPLNTYGEELYLNTPKLILPTIMWHKHYDGKMGVELSAYGNQKLLTGATNYLSGNTKSLNTVYYDLADQYGNIVGKIFNDLKLFTIEDQELLFAMSYKANRSWTLPQCGVAINSNVGFGCVNCALEASIVGANPVVMGGNGTITVSGATVSDIDANMPVFIEIRIKSTNTLFSVQLHSPISGTTIINVPTNTYIVKVYDNSAPDCYLEQEVVIGFPDIIDIYDLVVTEIDAPPPPPTTTTSTTTVAPTTTSTTTVAPTTTSTTTVAPTTTSTTTAAPKVVDFCLASSSGADGPNPPNGMCSYKCFGMYTTPPMTAGECFDLTVNGSIQLMLNGIGTSACIYMCQSVLPTSSYQVLGISATCTKTPLVSVLGINDVALAGINFGLNTCIDPSTQAISVGQLNFSVSNVVGSFVVGSTASGWAIINKQVL